MKKLLLITMLALILSAGTALAVPEVYLKEVKVDPGSTGVFHFPMLNDLNVYYGEYDLAIDWDKEGPGGYEAVSGFCVEYAIATTANNVTFGLYEPTGDYLKAAWIFDQYLAGGVSAQAAQIAIWEALFDTGNDPTSGDFYAKFTHPYVTEAADLLKAGFGDPVNSYWIAVSPVNTSMGTEPQDYIIRRPVPEPATMLLLGVGLLGLAGIGRRKFR